MNNLEILLYVVLGVAAIAYAYIIGVRPQKGSPIIAIALAMVFSAFTALQLTREGIPMFFANHAANLTGLQVWWDIVMCAVIAFFFIAPRARKQGMRLLPWAVFVHATVSIGLLVMCARLFWLENKANKGETIKLNDA